MSTKSKKRLTRQIRIESRVHHGLRLLAKAEHTTVSKLASKICEPHVAKALRTERKELARLRKRLSRLPGVLLS